ncbi:MULTISPECIES: transposase [unclassified Acinetobacter]|uniref:transposase n=1 Tax=unclassified Acinetobacter TaxID=196816 RepID=UPI002934A3EB|nr:MULTISPECIES: transposase [unclassified Acinetobacter]WOE33060.1 transposase [Acinetobacter sp. SAAs470]WOE39891.1 transposase [Acinetobacter sp. SAAs474]
MNMSNGWTTAKAVNGDIIRIKIIPFEKEQNTILGKVLVEVSKQIQMESGEKFHFNLDGRSFFIGTNSLYKLVC